MRAISSAIFLGCCCAFSAHASDLIDKCKPATYARAKSSPASLVDDFGNYREWGGVQFGESLQGQGYLAVGGVRVMLVDIPFRDLKGQLIRLRPDDLALSRALAYRSKSDSRLVCVISPLAGAGSSGSFQRTVGLIAVRKPHAGRALLVKGAMLVVH